jgi:hypothetical protein
MHKDNKRAKQYFILKKFADEENQSSVIGLGLPFCFILEKKKILRAFCF